MPNFCIFRRRNRLSKWCLRSATAYNFKLLIFEFIRNLIYKGFFFLMDNIADLGFVEIFVVVCINLDRLWAMNSLDAWIIFFFWVKCLFELILKFEGGPMDLKRSNFANEELKSILIFFSKILRGAV